MGVSTPGTDPSGAACDWLALLGDGEGWSAPAAAQHADGGGGAEAQLLAARRAAKGPQLMHDSFRSLTGAAALRAAATAGAAGAPWPDERDVAAGCDSDTPRAAHGGDESPAKRLGAGTPRRGDQLRRRLQQSLQPQQPQQPQQSQLNCKMNEHAQQARHPQRLDTSGSDDLDRAGSDATGCSDDVEEGLPVPSDQQQQQEQGQQQRQRRWGPTAQERTPLLLQPPCAGRYAAGVRYHTDPAPPRLLPRVGWELLGIASLIGYMALPLHLVIILVCAVTFSWPAVIFLTAIVGSLALPARPLMWAPFLEFALLRSIRTYFDFSFTLEDPAVLEKHVIWAGEAPPPRAAPCAVIAWLADLRPPCWRHPSRPLSPPPRLTSASALHCATQSTPTACTPSASSSLSASTPGSGRASACTPWAHRCCSKCRCGSTCLGGWACGLRRAASLGPCLSAARSKSTQVRGCAHNTPCPAGAPTSCS